MPKSKEVNEHIKEERKLSILMSALKLFSVRGYDAVRINEIAEDAGCSRGLLYHYYESKEDIFHDLMEYSHQKISSFNLFDRTNKDITAKDQLIHFFDAIINILNGDLERCYFFYMFINFKYQKTLPPPPNSKKPSKPKTMRQYIEELIAQGQKDGTILDGDPNEMTLVMYSLLRGLIFERLNTISDEYIAPKSHTIQRLLIKE